MNARHLVNGMLSRQGRGRPGIAAVELAAVLPLLCFICAIGVDASRVFYCSVTIADCARNGALYGSDSTFAATTPYDSIQDAALADASNLSPTPTVSSTNGTDANGIKYVEVTVSYTFETIIQYPGVPSSIPLSRTVRAAIAP